MSLRFDCVGIVSATPEENLKIAEFFRGTLNCPVEGEPLGGYAQVKIGDAMIELHVGARADVGPHGGTLIRVACDDVDAKVAEVRAKGGVIAAEPEDMPWGRAAYIAGPNGVMVDIFQPS